MTLAALLAVDHVPSKGDPGWQDVQRRSAEVGLCGAADGAIRRSDARSGAFRPQAARPQVPPAPPQRPANVLEAWNRCIPVTDDARVSAWVRGRALDPATVEERDLARALPGTLRVMPRWMRFSGRLWTDSSHRLIVPMYGPTGRIESLHARALAAREANGSGKAASPAGFDIRGLVMADAGGRSMLAGEFTPPALVVAEGVPDFLDWATRYSDADEDAPAVVGVIAGAWSDEIAARVCPGMTVYVRTHPDPAGFVYADTVCRSLARRRCRVHRRKGTA